MSWRKAHSLTTLLDQFNTACPYRSKKSDGFIGDENHKHRFSYHNPDRSGIVPAGDFTHDPAQGDPQSRFRMSVAGGLLTGPGCLEAAGLRREPGIA